VFKNLAMGLGAKGGKLEMHSQSKPHVTPKKCTACNECIEYCPHQAIEMKNDAAVITGRCTGCASCIMVCPEGAITFKWNEVSDNVQMKVVEYAAAVMKDRVMLHMNFVVRVTQNCDCMGVTEKALMPDVGVFASLDPVVCEQAAYDRCRKALDKAWPELTPEKQLVYAEQLGLGSRKYDVEQV
jgi:uncharacterized protein